MGEIEFSLKNTPKPYNSALLKLPFNTHGWNNWNLKIYFVQKKVKIKLTELWLLIYTLIIKTDAMNVNSIKISMKWTRDTLQIKQTLKGLL